MLLADGHPSSTNRRFLSAMNIYQNKDSIQEKPWIPYYYIIGWKSQDRWYVGQRHQYGCHPDELMVTYFTSSHNYVHPFIKENGLPDIRWTFPVKTAEEAIYHELRIMNEFNNFITDDRWLNKNKGGVCGPMIAKKYEYNGEMYTVVELSEMTDLSAAAIYERLKKGMSVKDTIAKINKLKLKHEYKGKLYTTAELSKLIGVSKSSLNRKFKKGMTVDDAINSLKVVSTYEYNGKWYSIKDLSNLSGLHRQTIYARLKAGLTVDQAIQVKIFKQ